MSLLEIDNLSVSFKTVSGQFTVVDRVSLRVNEGDLFAIVGESGSGKSVTMLALMGLLPWNAQIVADRIVFDGKNLNDMTPKQRRNIIGKDLTMIFQEPISSLNPCFNIGFQINDVLKKHIGGGAKQRKKRCVELLEEVGISEPELRLKSFPHQLSGGMCQRVMIAIAIACKPKLLIADEPTTALDVTIQAQILDLLMRLQKENNMALILITHDMGVVAETAKRVSIFYAGQKVEEQQIEDIFKNPLHPYTSALLKALPENAKGKKLHSIAGNVPGMYDQISGCRFALRCNFSQQKCHAEKPAYNAIKAGNVLCHYPLK